MHVDKILFGGRTEFEDRVRRSLEGLKLGSTERQNFELLGLSNFNTYSDHIKVVRPITKNTMLVQEFEKMSAADNEMTMYNDFVIM